MLSGAGVKHEACVRAGTVDQQVSLAEWLDMPPLPTQPCPQISVPVGEVAPLHVPLKQKRPVQEEEGAEVDARVKAECLQPGHVLEALGVEDVFCSAGLQEEVCAGEGGQAQDQVERVQLRITEEEGQHTTAAAVVKHAHEAAVCGGDGVAGGAGERGCHVCQ